MEQRLKIRLKFLYLLLYGIIIGNLVGCDPPNSQRHTHETLVFNVDRTRSNLLTDAQDGNIRTQGLESH